MSCRLCVLCGRVCCLALTSSLVLVVRLVHLAPFAATVLPPTRVTVGSITFEVGGLNKAGNLSRMHLLSVSYFIYYLTYP